MKYRQPTLFGLILARHLVQRYHCTFCFKICDAPARAFLKCITGHNGYYSCERCTAQGKSVQHRLVYGESFVGCEKRTDEGFANNQYTHHQKGVSPLTTEIKFNCVTGFPLDYMHLVLLGIVKRMLNFLIKGPPICRISSKQVRAISEKLINLNGCMPSEFNRQPRGLNDLPYWKATELRQFLLYHCPIVLKSIVSKNIYEHFMSLHFAMSILLNNKLIMVESMLDYAENVIVWFVSSSSVVFGEIFPTYNVHSLLHAVNDVRNFNTSLNNLSAFKFENHMQKLKRSVKNSNNPVVQIYKREFEIQQNSTKAEKNDVSRKVINVKQKNKCFNLKNKDICLVERVIEDGERYLVTVISKHYLIDLYCFPTKSSNIGITYIENLERVKKKQIIVEKNDLDVKNVCLPYKTGLAFFPTIHEYDS